MSSEDLHLNVAIDGHDNASAPISEAERTIKRFVESLTMAQRALRESATAWGADLNRMAEAARTAATSTERAIDAMRSDVLVDVRELKAEMGGVFAGLATGATENATKATAAITEGMTAAAEAMKVGAAGMSTVLDGLVSQAAALKAELAGLRVPGAPASANAGLANASNRGGKHGARWHGRGHAVLRAGEKGFDAISGFLPLAVTPGTALAGLGLGATYEAALQQHVAATVLETQGLDPTRDAIAQRDEILKRLQAGSEITGISVEQTGEAYMAANQLLSRYPVAERNSFIDKALPLARYESIIKGTSTAESLKSMIEMGEQYGVTDPKQLQTMLGQFAVASANSTDSLPELVRTSKYFIPDLAGKYKMEFGPMLADMLAMKSRGYGTSSGISLREYYDGLVADGKNKAHDQALRKLGLLGDDGKATFRVFRQDGTEDTEASGIRSGEILERALAGMTDTERKNTMHSAFGERGTRAAVQFAQQSYRESKAAYATRVAAYDPNANMFDQLKALDPTQSFLESWAKIKNTLADLGTVILPSVETGLEGLNKVLAAIDGELKGGMFKLPDGRSTDEKFWRFMDPGLADRLYGKADRPAGPSDVPPSDDRAPPVDMIDPRRGLLHRESFLEDGVDRGASRDLGAEATGMAPVLRLWQTVYEETREIHQAIAGPGMAAWQGSKADLDAIKDLVQVLGEGLAALARGGTLGGMGVTSASYETTGDSSSSGSGFGGGLGSVPKAGAGVGHYFSAAVREANLRYHAAINGIDPNVAMRVALSEGFNVFTGDHGKSFGDFQMFTGGGLGNAYQKATGKNPGDPRNELDLDAWAMRYASKHGWADWHGAARVGIFGRHGMNYTGPVPAAPKPPDPANLPSARGGVQHHGDVHVHVHGQGDPDQTAKSVVKAMNNLFAQRLHDVDFQT